MLEGRLRERQEENGMLMRKITKQRAEMESLLKGLEGVVADVEGSVGALRAGETGVGGDGLKAEIWEIEIEMQAPVTR
jgi:hypothetical protein